MGQDDQGATALKLRATDGEDLAVLSAALQDSIVPVMDMTYLAEDRRFVMVVNRFKWEAADDAGDPGGAGDPPAGDGAAQAYQRTHCGVSFFGVEHVRLRHVDLSRRQDMLSLLSVEMAEGGVRLVFAGGGEIRLDLAGGSEAHLDCRLVDLGEPWPTSNLPRHGFEDGGDSP